MEKILSSLVASSLILFDLSKKELIVIVLIIIFLSFVY